ncbi:hypothetical protein LTR36_005348 [Oleoguttula mirabilis]|uniref:Trafficking protein particle complex II-specific subunit 65 IgD3 domain-containing protein n=1 Tax=Oleoguttula mirabilis TaxID=1507867 RepID=A0AAV9JFX7_9PEZI|nr:hypothetical protein LTR36_005348 [Oleoguttula mirabilis]
MEDHDDLKSRFEALSKGAYFEVLVPRSSDFDALTVLRDGSPEELAKAPTRRNLFFDERARVQLVLKTPIREHEVRNLLRSLQIVLAAHATDAVPQGSSNAASASGKHDFTSVTIAAGEGAEVLEVGEQTYVVWKPTLHIPWPPARLQRPAIYFTANLLIIPETTASSDKAENDYLTAYEPLPANVLEPLNFDPAFRGKKIYLSEDRITKTAPKGIRTTLKDHVVKPVRGASKRAFPTMPALFTRMKYATTPDSTIASLHIESSQAIAGIFVMKSISLHASGPADAPRDITNRADASSTLLTANSAIQDLTGMTFPMQMQAGDETVLLYRLGSKTVNIAPPDPTSLSVTIQATATLEQGSQIDLDITWQSQVSSGESTQEPTYKWSREPNVSLPHEARLLTQSIPAPASFNGPSKPAGVDSGVTFFFTAPATAHQGQDMQLKIKCINKCSRSRRFAVLPLRHQEFQAIRQALPSSDNAEIVARNFNAPLLGRQKAADVFCDTPEVRIGPMPSGACFETEMNFRVLTSGVLDFGIVRILDLDSRQTVDVSQLPDVISLEAIEGEEPYLPRSTVPRRKDKITKQMEAASQQWRRETAEWVEQKAGRTGDHKSS